MWTVDESLKSKYLDFIVISTDDNKIIKLSRNIPQIKTIKRSSRLCKQKTKTADVILDFINKNIFNFDIICLLQPTSPLRTAKDIDKSIEKMFKNNAKSLVSINYSNAKRKFPVEIEKNFLRYNKKSSKTESGYQLNGAIYLSDVNFFKKRKTFFTNRTLTYQMPKSRSVDVDTRKDLYLCEKILNN
tara:strand:- start:827 stop:1387 length:561 start_codon:yes stop_codon:yes gene_type:complete